MEKGDLATWVGSAAALALLFGGFIGWLLGIKEGRKREQLDESRRRQDVARDHVRLSQDSDRNEQLGAIADKVEDLGSVELDVIPELQSERAFGPFENQCAFWTARVTNRGNRTARIRDAVIETEFDTRIHATWATIDDATSGIAEANPLMFDLPRGKSCRIYFAHRTKDEAGLPTLKAPRYDEEPWSDLTTAKRVVVQCFNSAHPSVSNSQFRIFSEWVSDYSYSSASHPDPRVRDMQRQFDAAERELSPQEEDIRWFNGQRPGA